VRDRAADAGLSIHRELTISDSDSDGSRKPSLLVSLALPIPCCPLRLCSLSARSNFDGTSWRKAISSNDFILVGLDASKGLGLDVFGFLFGLSSHDVKLRSHVTVAYERAFALHHPDLPDILTALAAHCFRRRDQMKREFHAPFSR
jgi:hypothetical protein